MLAWLDTYHERDAHSRALHAAVVLDPFRLPKTGSGSDKNLVTGTNIKLNMLNGQLPNLDFFNLCVRMLVKYSLTLSIFDQEDFWGHDQTVMYWHYAKTGFLALEHQQSPFGTINTSLHSVFGSFGIEALTLELVQSKWCRKVPLIKVANVLVGILRSVNNLMERFHQSYFFYVLLSTHNFVPLAAYMPIIGLILGPILFKYLNDPEERENHVDFCSVTLLLIISNIVGNCGKSWF